MTVSLWVLLGIVATLTIVNLGWRWASRIWSLPCPSLLAWSLESPLAQRLSGTKVILERLGLKPGQKIVEIGPGPGRLLIPAAQRILPGGEAIGIDIQPGMIQRLQERTKQAGLTNLTTILGDAAQPHISEGSADLVFLCTVLGEIPDRAGSLAQCFRALKPGGTLSITEILGDPHYQSRAKVRQLAGDAGFQLQSIEGGWRIYTATFKKPTAAH
jgi:SAM-dependent methyltransferase